MMYSTLETAIKNNYFCE